MMAIVCGSFTNNEDCEYIQDEKMIDDHENTENTVMSVSDS
eukprot:CAMPEP_0178972404 /NCGR_PEP_ID=MMETSP0789-20121207/20992_1 /TAXON_ID=3005 /ORGANISM="Rhizosolenia setigera, Strain CCMP 1694" /LENGTH=40 /DNA_ID= /DNA_START= /DNA_END= /DNA_ORIENTATION=